MISSMTGRGSLSLSNVYFETVTAPLFLLMYILMAIAPAAAWGSMTWTRLGQAIALPLGLSFITAILFALGGMQQAGALAAFFAASFAAWVVIVETLRGYRTRKKNQRTTAALTIVWELFTRNSRRYGGYLIHFGVALIGIGIIGSSVFQQETQGTLQAGESLWLGGYELRFEQFHDEIIRDGIHAEIAQLAIWQDGTQVAMLEPGREVYPGIRTQIMTVAAAHSTLAGDLYVILADWQQDGSLTRATFKVYFNPLINLIWIGGLLLIAGTIWTVLPRIILPAHARQELWDAPAPRPLLTQSALQGDAG
jgi:cytochrome c-type biogenesis protein CcmF